MQTETIVNKRVITANSPILLRRIKKAPCALEAVGNMTVVTTRGGIPENGDQMTDPTAPRKDR